MSEKSIKIAVIVAISRNRAIGVKGNRMPWHLPRELEHFRATTRGFPVIMGRKTWESIPEKFRPMKDRDNIIVTRDDTYSPTPSNERTFVCLNLETALKLARERAYEQGKDKIFIMGGAEIYQQAMASGLVDEIHLTRVEMDVTEATAFFPEFSAKDYVLAFEELREEKDAETGARVHYALCLYRRKKR